MAAIWDSVRSVWTSPGTPNTDEPDSEVRLQPAGMSTSTPKDEGKEDTVRDLIRVRRIDDECKDSQEKRTEHPFQFLPPSPTPLMRDFPLIEDMGPENDNEWFESQYALPPAPAQQQGSDDDVLGDDGIVLTPREPAPRLDVLSKPARARGERGTTEYKITVSEEDIDWETFTKSYNEFVTAKNEAERVSAVAQAKDKILKSASAMSAAPRQVQATYPDVRSFAVPKPKVTVYTDENALKYNHRE